MGTSLRRNVRVAPRHCDTQLLITGSEPQPTGHVSHQTVDVLLPIAFLLDAVLETVEYELASLNIDRVGDGFT